MPYINLKDRTKLFGITVLRYLEKLPQTNLTFL